MIQAPNRARIEAIWRIESATLIAALTRVVRDVGTAEDLAQDALVTAMERWATSGVPENPGAWLMTTARNRAIDFLRRRQLATVKHEELGRSTLVEEEAAASEFDTAADEDVGDDLLRLIFIACHPVLARESRVALTLKVLGGLSTEEIARAFLIAETTAAQRIVRAKRTLAAERVPFELPPAAERRQRVDSVLEVIYLIFNEGYAATSGEDWVRPGLCQEAIRLGRILAALTPEESEVHGLLALLELQASRLPARVGRDGEPVLLLDQNRSRWDGILIDRGLSNLARAESSSEEPGPYTLQAAIAACHARARIADATDWHRISALYLQLGTVAPSPIVELNRAVAVGMAHGPAPALAIVDGLQSDPALRDYHLLPATRADLLIKLGRLTEAHAELLRAASLTQNQRERQLLLERAARIAAALAE
ncbi:MAG: RNA polymerase sigma factor [Chloroflexota bacterium]